MLNAILAGPIIRKCTENEFVLWWLSPAICQGHFVCYLENQQQLTISLTDKQVIHYRVGEHAVIHLLHVVDHNLPAETLLEYDLLIDNNEQTKNLAQIIPTICYNGFTRPNFIIQTKISSLLHGSCRNPHHSSHDSLLEGDKKLADTLSAVQQRPALLMMSGDQIYADHVAGPTLQAIHQVIKLLGLYGESFDQAKIDNSEQLHNEQSYYYQRENLLPLAKHDKFWQKNKQSAIFTSAYAHNHLISFAEMIAMYALTWSPQLWQQVKLDSSVIPEPFIDTYHKELAHINSFAQGLDKVQRLLAHIPTYMIFDDHDVTDDWNLTAGWEQAAYQHPFAQRIIGNALFAYWLCQAWGNDPKQFDGDFWQQAEVYHQEPTTENQQVFIDYLYQFEQWQYQVETSPKLVVLDSRTRRWRSESNLNKPSGLMDWEALCQLQQSLINEPSVILVSPAPMFGVKLIETIQRIATLCGHSLTVDAENWMAHPGAANTLLNIFRHPKTPQHFIILSGDVHYSFVYDIEIRFKTSSPKIWQITSSGIKNQFPMPHIACLDKLNRWLYGVYSPLNLFTKRRQMKIKSRSNNQVKGRRLIEQSGLGYVEINNDGSPKLICDLHKDKITEFIAAKED